MTKQGQTKKYGIKNKLDPNVGLGVEDVIPSVPLEFYEVDVITGIRDQIEALNNS